MAEGVLSKYVVSLATKATSPAHLVGQLQAQVVPALNCARTINRLVHQRCTNFTKAKAVPSGQGTVGAHDLGDWSAGQHCGHTMPVESVKALPVTGLRFSSGVSQKWAFAEADILASTLF